MNFRIVKHGKYNSIYYKPQVKTYDMYGDGEWRDIGDPNGYPDINAAKSQCFKYKTEYYDGEVVEAFEI